MEEVGGRLVRKETRELAALVNPLGAAHEGLPYLTTGRNAFLGECIRNLLLDSLHATCASCIICLYCFITELYTEMVVIVLTYQMFVCVGAHLKIVQPAQHRHLTWLWSCTDPA